MHLATNVPAGQQEASLSRTAAGPSDHGVAAAATTALLLKAGKAMLLATGSKVLGATCSSAVAAAAPEAENSWTREH
jgi:hypothetical protein